MKSSKELDLMRAEVRKELKGKSKNQLIQLVLAQVEMYLTLAAYTDNIAARLKEYEDVEKIPNGGNPMPSSASSGKDSTNPEQYGEPGRGSDEREHHESADGAITAGN